MAHQPPWTPTLCNGNGQAGTAPNSQGLPLRLVVSTDHPVPLCSRSKGSACLQAVGDARPLRHISYGDCAPRARRLHVCRQPGMPNRCASSATVTAALNITSQTGELSRLLGARFPCPCHHRERYRPNSRGLLVREVVPTNEPVPTVPQRDGEYLFAGSKGVPTSAPHPLRRQLHPRRSPPKPENSVGFSVSIAGMIESG